MFTNNFYSQLEAPDATRIDRSISQTLVSQSIMSSLEEDNLGDDSEDNSEDDSAVNLLSPLSAELDKEIFLDRKPYLDILNDNFSVSEVLTNLYAQVSEANYITLYDRELIKLTLLQENLKEEEHRIINRLLYSIRRGWIKLVDDVHSTLVFDQSRRFCRL